MATRHIYAKTAAAARRKATGKTITVTKVNLLKNKPVRKGMKCYSVTTRKKITHTKRGWGQDKRRKSQQPWEKAYRKRKRAGKTGRTRTRRTKASRSAAAKRGWAKRRRKYGKSGFSPAGRRKIASNLRKGRRKRRR